ncbi:mitochondrial import inner membrane translocase subunit Tim8 B-like [Ruditapes philippinarum]|uniref:mitochondrial import inner membrane translocase subunit Tim8 B-like n=1 Tax=Ruditapes philippinarum TaxID=129788 RepID=UPI00295B38A3|nr:mitochondrial import inner membrane translocase subunit Tim8 B-like [Ruditapes philippinarum]
MDNPKLQRFIQVEQQKVQSRAHIEMLTERCWDKCVGYPSNKLDSKTENCVRDCVFRYIDSSNYVANRLRLTAERVSQTPQPFS